MNRELIQVVEDLFQSLRGAMSSITKTEFSQPMELYSGSTLGQHTRHFVEFFQCLLQQSPAGVVNYDKRERNKCIEEDPKVAFEAMEEIVNALGSRGDDLALKLESNYGSGLLQISTTFERELVFNIEHTVHHMALLKIGLKHLHPDVQIAEGFGVACSTQRHKEEICVR